jgi:hypothetical protein
LEQEFVSSQGLFHGYGFQSCVRSSAPARRSSARPVGVIHSVPVSNPRQLGRSVFPGIQANKFPADIFRIHVRLFAPQSIYCVAAIREKPVTPPTRVGPVRCCACGAGSTLLCASGTLHARDGDSFPGKNWHHDSCVSVSQYRRLDRIDGADRCDRSRAPF